MVFWSFLGIFHRFFALLSHPSSTIVLPTLGALACSLPRHIRELECGPCRRWSTSFVLCSSAESRPAAGNQAAFSTHLLTKQNRHKFETLFQNIFSTVSLCSLVSIVMIKAPCSCSCDFAQFRDGSEKGQFPFFSEEKCPKFPKIQSST